MKYLYRTYQLLIAAPILAVATILTALVTSVGCLIGNAHFWGYYPGKCWSWLMCRMLLIPVHVIGRENIDHHTSYVFVANHQGQMDIFLIYGFLGRNFKWMMKKALRRIPLVGYACEKARHIFVDKSGPKKIQETYDRARATLRGGTSLVVFPEGARTFTGHMGVFRKGAFQLAAVPVGDPVRVESGQDGDIDAVILIQSYGELVIGAIQLGQVEITAQVERRELVIGTIQIAQFREEFNSLQVLDVLAGNIKESRARLGVAGMPVYTLRKGSFWVQSPAATALL